MLLPMARTPAPLQSHDHALVIRLGAVGDVLRTLPAVHLIRKAYPGLHLVWIVEDLSRDLLEGHPEIDEVIRFPRREIRADRWHPRRLAGRLADLRRDLRSRRFGVALDFQGSLKSGLLALLSGAPRRVGFAPGHSRELSFLCATEWVRPASRWLNRVEKNLVLAEAVGATGDEVTVILPERRDEGTRAEAILREAAPGCEPVVVVAPGTSRLQRHKRWPAASFARLALLGRRSLGCVSLVTWGPGEENLARAVVAASEGAARLAPPMGLRLLASVLRRAALFVGADTGPMHLAWVVGCPVVALFGPTDPRLNAPLGEGHVLLRAAGPIELLPPEEVIEAARRALRGRPPSGTPAAAPRLSRRLLSHPATGPLP